MTRDEADKAYEEKTPVKLENYGPYKVTITGVVAGVNYAGEEVHIMDDSGGGQWFPFSMLTFDGNVVGLA